MEISALSKRFGDKDVLVRFSASVETGGITAITGPSGCGKSTLLLILMGLLNADQGAVSGIPRRLGAVFQEDRLCESFDAVENVRIVLAKPDTAIITGHFARVGMRDEELRIPVSKLSGGMRRRVAIVRAMMAECEGIFLDEPFKGLDKMTRSAVIRYILEERRGRTLVYVSHEKAELEELGGARIDLPFHRSAAPSGSHTQEA